MTKNLLAFILMTIAFVLPSFCAASPIKESRLSNGIKIIEREKKGEVTAFTILIKLGLFDEKSHAPGIRDFFAYLIEKSAYENKTLGGVSILEAKGAKLSCRAKADYIAVSCVCRQNDFPSILDIISNSIVNASQNDKIYKNAQKKYIDEHKPINGIIDNVYSLFLKEFYKYHPYKQIKQYSLLTVERTSREEMSHFIKETLTANRIVFAFSGETDENKLHEILEKHFGNLRNEIKKTTELQWEAKAEEKQLFLSSLSGTGWLVIGFRFPSYSSPDYPAMLAAKNIIGNGFASRLWEELREKRGLAYDLGAVSEPLEGPAHVMFYIVIQPKNSMQVRKISMEIIEQVKKQGVSQQELDTACEKIKGEYLLMRETGAGFTESMAAAEAIGSSYRVDEGFLKKVDELTVEQVRKACEDYLNDPMIIIVRPPGLYLNDTYY